ncbi:MAG TPA: hypothetical protein VJ725_23970 [Thermoanaerobaculia bacterium]|nr:hypothetical protein [Thermoanaerobaculia bacterium]
MDLDEKSFSLGAKFFADLRRAMLTRLVPLFLAILAVALLVHPPGVETDSSFTWIMACVLIPIVCFGGWRGYKRQLASYQGYRLFLTQDRLRRVQPGLPDMEISRSEVTRLFEAPGKALTLFGSGYHRFIAIPASLDGYEEVRAQLVSWKTPEQRQAGLAAWYPALAGLLTIIAYAVVIASSNRTLVTTLGALLIGALLYSTVVMYKSPQLDAKAKKVVWFMPLVILSVAARIWMVWNP